jgi:hypothetical protein
MACGNNLLIPQILIALHLTNIEMIHINEFSGHIFRL